MAIYTYKNTVKSSNSKYIFDESIPTVVYNSDAYPWDMYVADLYFYPRPQLRNGTFLPFPVQLMMPLPSS